jgi:hypothetical protein
MRKYLLGFLLLPVIGLVQSADPVSIKDFKPVIGQWQGTLTYLDYSSGKPFSMPARIKVSRVRKNDQLLILSFRYPDEPKANENDTLVISRGGSAINGAAIVSKEWSAGGLLQIITEERGTDGNENRKALLKHIYQISKKVFSIRKEVKFDGGQNFILRNEYKMGR